MYTSTYEMEKLAKLKYSELVQYSEINSILRIEKQQEKRAKRSVPSSTCLAKKSTCSGCA